MVIHEFNAFKIMYRFISWRKFKKQKHIRKHSITYQAQEQSFYISQVTYYQSSSLIVQLALIFVQYVSLLCPFKKIYIFNFFLKTTMPWVVFHFWFDNLEDKRNLNCKIYELNNDVHQWPLEWGQICKEKASFSKLFLFIPTRGEGKKE